MTDWKGIVGAVAPAIATALGGPLAGLGVSTLAAALGLGDDANEDDVARALDRATPEQLLAVKRAEMDFSARLKELDIDLERLAVADRASARRRETATGDSWTPRLLAVLTLGLFGGCVWWAFSGDMGALDPAQSGIIGGVIGYASAKADTVVGYYFGGSVSGSQPVRKDERRT